MTHSHVDIQAALNAAYEQASKQIFYPRSTVRCERRSDWTKISRRRQIEVDGIANMLRRASVLVILWPCEYNVPSNIEAAYDLIVDVDAVRPAHLIAAAKSLSGQVIDLADAKKLLEYPNERLSGRPATSFSPL